MEVSSVVIWAKGHLDPHFHTGRPSHQHTHTQPSAGVWDSCFCLLRTRRREPSRWRLGWGRHRPAWGSLVGDTLLILESEFKILP